MIALLLAPTPASAGELLLDTFEAWGARATSELALDDIRPERAVLAAEDVSIYSASTLFGGLVSEDARPVRRTRVEIVVGDDTLDSSRFDDRRTDGIATPSLVIEDVPIALDRDLWLATDASFKAAVQRWRVKSGALARLGERPPDWTSAEAVTAVDPAVPPPPDAALLRQLALAASGALRDLPGLRQGSAEVWATSGRYLLSTTEGTRLAAPTAHTVLYAWADVLREDGVVVYEGRQWVASTAAELPPAAAIAAEMRALGERVLARAEAPIVQHYVGPVLFEGEAAADLLRYLVPAEVEGTPPLPRPDETYEKLTRHGPRVGRRLLPEGWTVRDDPSAAPPGLPGGYRFDMEGVSGQPVEVVTDGFVRRMVQGRVPRSPVEPSNGHARGALTGRWEGRMSVWTVEPDRTRSDRAFRRAVEHARRDVGLDRILVVRALSRGRNGAVPQPTDAVWRDASGREAPVLALDFHKDDRRALRDIVAAAGRQTRAYLAPYDPTSAAPRTNGLPTVVIGPERLLVSELEAVFPGGTEQPSALPAPEVR